MDNRLVLVVTNFKILVMLRILGSFTGFVGFVNVYVPADWAVTVVWLSAFPGHLRLPLSISSVTRRF